MYSSHIVSLVLSASTVFAKVKYVGINIAGLDFGCDNYGTCPLSSAVVPDATGQVQHFVNDDGLNIFRYPVSWQYLVNNDIGGTLDSTNFGKYDDLIQTCLATGSYCAIDLHNYAHVDTLIIGQGGPTDAVFADLWSQLATKYASEEKIIFGLMNEPHDVDITIWAATCQAAVTAIRTAGATSQMILLPGNNFASAGQFVPNGSGDALKTITNLDGTTDNLIMDLHKYLDSDNSGNSNVCTTDNTADFAIVAAFLRENGRLGLISETGAGHDASCYTDFCAQNTFLNQNSDVFLGYIAWAAGAFDTSYVDSLTPTLNNGVYTDNSLAASCVIAPWNDAGTSIVTSAIPTSALAAVETIVSTSAQQTSESVTASTTVKSSTKSATASVTSVAPEVTPVVVSGTTTATTLDDSTTTVAATLTTVLASGSGGLSTSATTSASSVQVTAGAAEMTIARNLLFGGLVAALLI